MAEHQANVGKSVESSGKTVEEAVDNALSRLQLPRERVEVTVLREASRGLLGFGAHDAIVRLTVLPPAGTGATTPVIITDRDRSGRGSEPAQEIADAAPAQEAGERAASEAVEIPASLEKPAVELPAALERPAVELPTLEKDEAPKSSDRSADAADEGSVEDGEIARQVLLELIERMGVIADAQLLTREPEDEKDRGTIVLDIIGDDLGLLIGRRGETLNDLQYITRQLVAKEAGHWVNLLVDVEGYKQRREDRVRQLAQRMAKRVADTGRPAHMEPMNSYERRLVHLELRKVEGVETESTGEGERRKVGIFPTGWAD